MTWTDDKIERLKALWSEGYSVGNIARKIGGFEHCEDGGRCSVLGKAHRIGLTKRTPNNQNTTLPAKMAKKLHSQQQKETQNGARATVVRSGAGLKSKGPIAPEPFIAIKDIDIPACQRRTFDELEDNHCRWPVGDPREDGFHFCGGSKVVGLPYCAHHISVAYRPSEQGRTGGTFVRGAVSKYHLGPGSATPRIAATVKRRETETA